VAAPAAVNPPGVVGLAAAELHPSVNDPLLDSMNFLNEVMDRYPDAISFAPGAPDESFFVDIDVAAYLQRFSDYLCDVRGLDQAGIRRALFQYGPSQGLINDLVAEALRRDLQIPAQPQDVVITVGCQEALVLALRVLHRDGDVLAVVSPSYVGVTGAARLLDIPVVAVQDLGAGPDLEVLRSECARVRALGGRVRSLYVAPDFANPSGSRLDLSTRKALLDHAERLDLLVLEDSAYAFTAADDAPLPTLKALDTTSRVVHFGTFAKVAIPGARVGYVVADQWVRDGSGDVRRLAVDLATAKSMVTVNTSPIAQALIGGMLLTHGGSLATLGRAKADRYRENLRLLIAALRRHLGDPADRVDGIGWTEPTGGFFLRMRLPVPADEALLHRCASEFGVLWTPMQAFYIGGGGEREIRLSCSYLKPAQIDEGVRRLALFLADIDARD
jgi:(S)-3,5-dihydroxyphenylglycine transaminase